MSAAKAMAVEAEILRYERQVNQALRRMSERTGYAPASYSFPLREVFEASVDGSLDEWACRKETVRALFDFLLADGPEPWNVMRRLYAMGAHMGIEPFCLLNVRERGLLLGNSHGAQHWMTRRIVAGLERKGALSTKAPGQKGKEASAAASKAQMKNCNRRGGKKVRPVNGQAFPFSSTGAAEHQTKRSKQTHEKAKK